MVPQQEPTTPQAGQLLRSGSKTAAIRRGDLKISAPILLPDDDGMPVAKSQTELTHTTPNGPLVRDSLSCEERPDERGMLDKSEVHDSVVDEQPSLRHKPSTLRKWSATQARGHPPPKGTTTPSNNAGPFESFLGSNGKIQPRKKQKGGSLRAVFRKVFGRKPRPEITHHGYHRSDPIVLPTTISRTENKDGDEKYLARQRVFSMPIQEITPKTSLHSHLPFPMNVNAPELIDPPHDYLSFESSPHVHRRRATLPSTVVNSIDVAALSAFWNNQEPVEREQGLGQTSEREIGLAITSPNKEQRRSRSAGALQETARQQGYEGPMRRSAEILYWRPSYDGVVPQSVRTSSETKVRTSPEDIGGTSHPQTPEPSTDETTAPQEEHTVALDFVNVETHDHSNESTAQRPPTTHACVSRIEQNTQCLEHSLYNVTGRSHQQTIILPNAPKTLRSRQCSRSPLPDLSSHPTDLPSATDDPPHGALAPASTASSATPPPHTHTHQPTLLASPASPTSPDWPPSPKPSSTPPRSPATADLHAHLRPLHASLRHERAARKTLEALVRALQREVRELGAAIKRDSRGGANLYPTPSPDGGPLGASVGVGVEKGRGRHCSRFSGSEGDEGDEEEKEMFETPREEQGAFGFGTGSESEGEGEIF